MITLTKTNSPTANIVTINNIELLFSYETVVAYRVAGSGWVASENVWSQTTGKHISQTTGIKPVDRTPRAQFQSQLAHYLP